MNQTSAAQKFNAEFQKALEAELFDVKGLQCSIWYNQAQRALTFASPMSLGISAKEFNNLVDIDPDTMTLFQFAILNNNLEKTSADQLDVPMIVYCNLINISNDLAIKWNEKADVFRAEIMARLVLEQQEIDKAAGKPVFKPIKAEA